MLPDTEAHIVSEEMKGFLLLPLELDGSLFMLGANKHWTCAANNRHMNPKMERRSLDEVAGKPRGVPVTQHGAVPGLLTMQLEHGNEAHTIVKAAIAIFNNEQTGTDRAFFWNSSSCSQV